ncbi:hypothetical protein PTKIN_Ptkin11bG0159400 [Pterospermum kingtungense]
MTRRRSIYSVDYSCCLPPSHLKAKYHQFMDHSALTGDLDESCLKFQRKILERSGLGEETCVHEAMHYLPPRPSMAAARQEAELVMFGALDTLLANTNVNPRDIGILVVNCSLFNPTSSLFNIEGMKCSSKVIAVALAKDMFQVHRNSYGMVVSIGSHE